MTLLIPTRRYIKEWIEHDKEDNRKSAEEILSLALRFKSDALHRRYNSKLDAYAELTFSGHYVPYTVNKDIHPARIEKFNRIMGRFIRNMLLSKMRTYLDFDYCLVRAAEYARNSCGIDEESYPNDNLLKHFQRRRAKVGGKYIYNKKH